MRLAFKNPLITFTNLFFTVNLKNGQRVYDKINMNDNGNLSYPESRLMDDHLFLPMYSAYFLTKYSKNEGATNTFDGNYPWFTYPDENFFSDAPAGGVKEADCLRTIYFGGFLTMTIGGQMVMREIPGIDMLYRPGRPFASTAGSGEASPVQQEWGPGAKMQGYHRLENDIVLKGKQDNKLTVSLGSGDVTNLEGGNDNANLGNKLIVAFKGLLYYGETSAQKGFCNLPG